MIELLSGVPRLKECRLSLPSPEVTLKKIELHLMGNRTEDPLVAGNENDLVFIPLVFVKRMNIFFFFDLIMRGCTDQVLDITSILYQYLFSL